jgi:glycosyltransferase involved in cell wall biosynthesis
VTDRARFCFDARTAQHHFPGIGRYASNLARALATNLAESESLLVLRPDAINETPAAGVQGETVAVRQVDCSPFSLRQHWIVPRLLRESAVTTYHSPYFLMPLRAGLPTVLTIHDLIPLRDASGLPLAKRLAFRAVIELAVRRAAAIIVPTGETADDIARLLGVAAERIEVIPYAADPALVAAPPLDVRARFDLPSEFALCVGSNRTHKNHARLCRVWKSMKEPRPLLVFAGSQPSAALDLEPGVRFLGRVTDPELSALYRGAHLLILPSQIEGFGLPVVEAMACGCAVACSDTPALREVAGDAAAFFDPSDADEMIGVLHDLLQDDGRRETLRRRGTARTTAFSWSHAARRTLDVYRRVAGS